MPGRDPSLATPDRSLRARRREAALLAGVPAGDTLATDEELLSGGSSAPTDVLVLGVDVTMLNTWTAASIFDWGDYPARIYKQNGRVHMQGAVISGAGSVAAVADFPSDYAPALFGETLNTGATWRWLIGEANGDGLAAQARITVDTDGVHLSIALLSGAHPAEGNEYYLDSISWPLNFTGPD